MQVTSSLLRFYCHGICYNTWNWINHKCNTKTILLRFVSIYFSLYLDRWLQRFKRRLLWGPSAPWSKYCVPANTPSALCSWTPQNSGLCSSASAFAAGTLWCVLGRDEAQGKRTKPGKWRVPRPHLQYRDSTHCGVWERLCGAAHPNGRTDTLLPPQEWKPAGSAGWGTVPGWNCSTLQTGGQLSQRLPLSPQTWILVLTEPRVDPTQEGDSPSCSLWVN